MKMKFFAIIALCFCVFGASIANAAMLCCADKTAADATPPCHKTIDDSAKDKTADNHQICKSMTCFKAQTLPTLSAAKTINSSIEPIPAFQADKFTNSPAEAAFQPPKHIS